MIGFWLDDGENKEFSNWYLASFIWCDIIFCSTEQAFMWAKAIEFNDYDIAREILSTKVQKRIKELGRKVRGFDSEIWSKKSIQVMYEVNYEKYIQNENLKELLLSTGDEILAEVSPYDTIWGIGLSQNDIGVDDPKCWRGKNQLGNILMEIREKLKKA